MMKNNLIYSWLLMVLLSSCGGKDDHEKHVKNSAPVVTDNGIKIEFPDAESMAFFQTESVENGVMNADMAAPAKVAATVIKSEEGASQNIVLFENPELANNYTQLIQHLININQIQNINIKQKKTQLERTKDLQLHGAATGQDLLDAQMALSIEETNLANEKTAIIEHETKLKAGGFQPEVLRKAVAGTAYITCDLPENQISKIKEGSNCVLQFTAFPNEKFTGKIDDVADMIDQATRMIKLRVSINNASGKLKSGMFATVLFGVSEGSNLSINKNSLVTIQGRNYVFIKTGHTTFERREVSIGSQVGDRIIVYSGLNDKDHVAVKGAMQLKGLSFGY